MQESDEDLARTQLTGPWCCVETRSVCRLSFQVFRVKTHSGAGDVQNLTTDLPPGGETTAPSSLAPMLHPLAS